MLFIEAAIGFLISLFGRQFYALFVGGMTFLLSAYLTRELGLNNSLWAVLITSILAAFLAGLLTMMSKRPLAWLAGILAGITVVERLPAVFGSQEVWLPWPYVALVGLAAAAAMIIAFDPALIVISVLTGVVMMLTTIDFGDLNRTVLFLVFVIFCVVFQAVLLQYRQTSPD